MNSVTKKGTVTYTGHVPTDLGSRIIPTIGIYYPDEVFFLVYIPFSMFIKGALELILVCHIIIY